MYLLLAGLSVIVSIWMIMFLYPIFSNVLVSNFIPTINDTIANHSVIVNETAVNQVINTVQISWIWGPLILVIGLLVFLYLIASRKEYSREFA